MSGFQWKAINSIGAIVGCAFSLPNLAIAQSQTTVTQIDQPNRVSVAYVATKDLVLQEFYGRLKNQQIPGGNGAGLRPLIWKPRFSGPLPAKPSDAWFHRASSLFFFAAVYVRGDGVQRSLLCP